jgi:hypothetical protein
LPNENRDDILPLQAIFARFRQSHSRLQISLVDTRRLNGKVVHEHLASLGSIIMPPSVADRVTFWQRLREPHQIGKPDQCRGAGRRLSAQLVSSWICSVVVLTGRSRCCDQLLAHGVAPT